MQTISNTEVQIDIRDSERDNDESSGNSRCGNRQLGSKVEIQENQRTVKLVGQQRPDRYQHQYNGTVRTTVKERVGAREKATKPVPCLRFNGQLKSPSHDAINDANENARTD